MMSKEERNEYCRKYYRKNIEKIRKTKRIWAEKNKEKIKEKHRIWNKNNKERIKKVQKIWDNNNKDKISIIHKRYYQKNVIEKRIKHKKWYQENKERILKESKLRREKRKFKVFSHYGFKCTCCGEDTPLLLNIDHVNNDGREHRKKGIHLYDWLIKNNFPEGFQTLCWNCNIGKHMNGGICPHKKLYSQSSLSPEEYAVPFP